MPKLPYDPSGIDDRDLEAAFLREQKPLSILTTWQQRDAEAEQRQRAFELAVYLGAMVGFIAAIVYVAVGHR